LRNRVIAILVARASLAVTAKVHPQTMTLKAHVPFPIVVGNETFPVGTHQVQGLMGRPAEADEIGMIAVPSTDPRVSHNRLVSERKTVKTKDPASTFTASADLLPINCFFPVVFRTAFPISLVEAGILANSQEFYGFSENRTRWEDISTQ
jgi:hypothetical protein